MQTICKPCIQAEVGVFLIFVAFCLNQTKVMTASSTVSMAQVQTWKATAHSLRQDSRAHKTNWNQQLQCAATARKGVAWPAPPLAPPAPASVTRKRPLCGVDWLDTAVTMKHARQYQPRLPGVNLQEIMGRVPPSYVRILQGYLGRLLRVVLQASCVARRHVLFGVEKRSRLIASDVMAGVRVVAMDVPGVFPERIMCQLEIYASEAKEVPRWSHDHYKKWARDQQVGRFCPFPMQATCTCPAVAKCYKEQACRSYSSLAQSTHTCRETPHPRQTKHV